MFVRALFDLNLLRIALRLNFLVLKPVAREGFSGVFTKITVKKAALGKQWLCRGKGLGVRV